MRSWTHALAALALIACSSAADAQQSPATIQLNQVGFQPGATKRAVLVSDAAAPQDWRVTDAAGEIVARGQTTRFGRNAGSGQVVHTINLSSLDTPGRGYVLRVGDAASHPFDIDAGIYTKLKTDALAFFYHQRASIAIEAQYVGETWARPIAHAPDSATCPQRDSRGNTWAGCPYTLDASRGWYDAGDQGKYIVNGGITVWTLLNYYERTQGRAFTDGSLAIPERGNGVNDLLDEVRWELEFMLAMQAPEGARLSLPRGGQNPTALQFTEVNASGMAHHKIHDDVWTPVPTPPHLDRQPRVLSYPTTAATLNLAANAAQCARIWREIDAEFSARCLAAARRAYDAAERVPDVFAYDLSAGSGGYGDTQLSDEFYWAAAELFLTTGEDRYARAMRSSPHWLSANEFGWPQVNTLATISIATIGAGEDQTRARAALVRRADLLRAESAQQGYAIPFNRNYVWGSNSDFANRGIVLALAYDYTGDRRYRDEVVNVMDYLLGRNPLDQSYVSGYGERPMVRPHHRFWTHSADPSLPPPPPGVLAGGPNFNRPADPVALRIHAGCHAQTCYADEVEAYSLNEVAINWNAPFFWIAAFLDEPNG